MWFICNMFSWCTFGKQNYGLLHILYTLFPKWLEFFSLWNLNTFTFIQKWLALHSRYTFCQPLFVCKSNPWHWHHYCRAVLFELQGMFKDFFLYTGNYPHLIFHGSHISLFSPVQLVWDFQEVGLHEERSSESSFFLVFVAIHHLPELLMSL